RLKLARNLLDIGDITPSKIYNYSTDDLNKVRKNEYNFNIADDNSKLLIDYPKLEQLYFLDINNPVLLDLKQELSFYPLNITWFNNSNSIIAANKELLVDYNISSRNKSLIYYS